MAINRKLWGRTPDGKAIYKYTMTNASGASVVLGSVGAAIVGVNVPDKDGKLADVVLGYGKAESYFGDGPCFGKCPGRFANRIAAGRFTLDGKTYTLPVNNGPNHLHGGPQGFQNQVWDSRKHKGGVEFKYVSADGEMGYPGNVVVVARYEWSEENELRLTFSAKSDARTVINLTNHAYFNLKGEGEGDIRDHRLQVFADEYIPYDETVAPTGEVLPVEGTPMDFREPVVFGDRMDNPFFATGRGIDNGWALPGWREYNDRPGILQRAAVLSGGGRTMEVWTTFPCLQVYSGNYVERHIGKSGRIYDVQHAVCMEAQGFPDAVNHPLFPSPVLRPGETFTGTCQYRFVNATNGISLLK